MSPYVSEGPESEDKASELWRAHQKLWNWFWSGKGALQVQTKSPDADWKGEESSSTRSPEVGRAGVYLVAKSKKKVEKEALTTGNGVLILG